MSSALQSSAAPPPNAMAGEEVRTADRGHCTAMADSISLKDLTNFTDLTDRRDSKDTKKLDP